MKKGDGTSVFGKLKRKKGKGLATMFMKMELCTQVCGKTTCDKVLEESFSGQTSQSMYSMKEISSEMSLKVEASLNGGQGLFMKEN